MENDFMDEDGKKRKGCFTRTLYIAVVGIIILPILWNAGLVTFESAPEVVVQDDSVEEAVMTSSPDFKVTETEWRALQKEVKQLRSEVNRLKQGNAKTIRIRKIFSSKRSATSVRANDITLADYSHERTSYNATVAFKNNTDRTVSSVTGRMVYYDMSNNMLDYKDFTVSVIIDPGMVKRVELQGYGYRDDYTYYKNETTNLYRKYKVKFELKSYKVK